MIRVNTTLDQTALRRTFGCFPSGVMAVCASVDGRPVGMAASSFTSVSLDPPLGSICISNASETWSKLRSADLIGASVLNEMQSAICRRLSGTGDRFVGVPWDTSAAGTVLIVGAAAWLECTVSREIPAGDHLIVLLSIHGAQANQGIAPLVHHAGQFRGLRAERKAVELPRPARQAVARHTEDPDRSRILDRIAQIVAASSF